MKKKKNALMKKGASIYDMINVIDAKIKELSKLKKLLTSWRKLKGCKKVFVYWVLYNV